MGSDQTPQALTEAVVRLSSLHPSCTFVLFGKDLTISPQKNIEVHSCSQIVEMDDAPLTAVRRKKESSMGRGIAFLAEKKIDAFVSSGNTGALVAFSRFNLSLLPGITSLSLLVLLPKEKGSMAVLDVGANISFKPEHLAEYAKLGRLYYKIVHGKENPTCGLLNIGVEEKKGTAQIKEGYQILNDYFSQNNDVFLGNIEGKRVFQNGVDVLVTDGFTGNVFLKTCEGVSSFLLDFFRSEMAGKGDSEQLYLSFQSRFNYSVHGGALLCGADGVVIKCHGDASPKAFERGIIYAIDLVEKEILKKMKRELER